MIMKQMYDGYKALTMIYISTYLFRKKLKEHKNYWKIYFLQKEKNQTE